MNDAEWHPATDGPSLRAHAVRLASRWALVGLPIYGLLGAAVALPDLVHGARLDPDVPEVLGAVGLVFVVVAALFAFGAPPTYRQLRRRRDQSFSIAMLSINQPAARTTAVGDTGPDSDYRGSSLIDPVAPSAVGGLLYGLMGFDLSDPAYHVPTAIGTRSPVDPNELGTSPGQAGWLRQQLFGGA